ncbi:MAG: hypothetical protein L0G99_00825 [Propionibacteriales bacterium]|nr:hypothetical protein [Propionibacteriales bacterium]
MAFEWGEAIITPGPQPSDEDNVRVPGWIASRTDDGFILTWDGGGIVAKEVGALITEAQASRLREHPEEFTSLALELGNAGLVHDMPR